MSETLYPYYERELIYIRQMAQEFARQYPAAAGRLLLEPDRSADPHVERLIESFAFLAGRIQLKLDDEFPELTDALLSVLYPHFLAPIPSMGIVGFELDPARAQLPQGFEIERHSRLHTSTAQGSVGRFRTGFPVSLWPVQVSSARFYLPPFPPGVSPPPRTAAVLRLQLDALGGLNFSEMALDSLRFFLSGESQMTAALYEVLFNHVLQVAYRPLDAGPGAEAIVLKPAECLGQVGFERDEGLLSYPNQSFVGYRVLTEFFAFPAKFLFVDLKGLRHACAAGYKKRMEVLIFLDRGSVNLEQGVGAETFRLGCTPIVNLFEQTAEPIALTQARYEYRVVPDVTNQDGTEVYSVDAVTSTDLESGTSKEFHPFYSFRHETRGEESRAFWYASRRPSSREKDRGTDVYLTLVDLDFHPSLPAESTLVVRTTCTNRDLPNQLRQAGEQLRFELETTAPLAQIRTLRLPSAPLRPRPRRGAYWRLVSQLCLNHLSLADTAEGRQALQEVLRLHDFSDLETGKQSATVNRQLIDGIASVSSRKVVGRIESPEGIGFCRGTEVTVEFDEPLYVGTGVFLFASVLERFFGLYCSINSFCQLAGKTKGSEGPFKRWPPRAGEHPLL